MRLSKILLGLFFLLGLALLGGMVWQVGSDGLLRSVQAMGPWIVPFLALETVPILLHTAGWAACFPPRRRPVRFWQLALVRHAGRAINEVTPTAEIGGEVLKVLLLSPVLSRDQATATVLIDKASVTLAKMVYLALGLLYLAHHLSLPAGVSLSVTLAVGLIFLGLVGFVASQRYGFLSRVLSRAGRLPIGQKTRQRVALLDAHLMAYHTRHPWRFVGSCLLHTAALGFQVVKTYLLLRLLLGDQTPVVARTVMVPVAVAALDQLFFFVPGRLGTLEGTRFVVLSALGVAQIYGLAFGLIARVEQLVWGGIGLLAYACFARLYPVSATGGRDSGMMGAPARYAPPTQG